MKTPLLLLLFAIAVCAQSLSGPCGSPSAIATDRVASNKPSPVAAKTSVVPASKDLSAERDGQPERLGPAARNVAAQIQSRRPGTLTSSACRCGTVGAGSLTAQSNSQEVTILTGLAGSFRFDHVLLQESTRFTSDSASNLEVGVGRTNHGTDVVSPFSLKSDAAPNNSWYSRTNPPQLTGAYDLALKFQATSPLGDGTASTFKAGVISWEICGYNAQ